MSHQRGFTLLELMLTLALVSITTAIMVQVVHMENKTMLGQLERAEAQQNARATISLLQRYARAAGWGMEDDVQALGAVAFGGCYDTTDTEKQALDCDGIDLDADATAGTDRLRVLSILGEPGAGAMLRQPFQAPAGADIPAHPDTLPLQAGHPLFVADAVPAVISGPCIGGGVGNDLVNVTGNGGPSPPALFTYPFTNLQSGASDFSCVDGYEQAFSFGKAQVADFWIDRVTDAAHPTLRLRLDPNQPLSTGWPVAYDIDDLQVRFMLDVICEENPDTTEVECPPPPAGAVGDTRDNVWDVVCDSLDPARPTANGGCNDDLDALRPASNLDTMGIQERFNRIVGAQIAIVARTRERQMKSGVTTAMWIAGATNLTVFNHAYKGRNDGYQRWIYRATVGLRNRQ